jgi:hypothetical protein
MSSFRRFLGSDASDVDRCDECQRHVAAIFEDGTGRRLCGDCLGRLHPEETIRTKMPGMWKTKEEQEALNKRVAEKKWLRLVDLPGYVEWAAQYHGLERIIPNLSEHHLLVHPDEMNGPMDWLFEREFQGWLNDFAERVASYGGRPRQTLDEFKNTA